MPVNDSGTSSNETVFTAPAESKILNSEEVNLFVVVPRFNGALKLIVYDVDTPKEGSNLFCKYNFVSEPLIAFKSTPSTLSCNFERTKVAPNLFKFVFLYKIIEFLIEVFSASAVWVVLFLLYST